VAKAGEAVATVESRGLVPGGVGALEEKGLSPCSGGLQVHSGWCTVSAEALFPWECSDEMGGVARPAIRHSLRGGLVLCGYGGPYLTVLLRSRDGQ